MSADSTPRHTRTDSGVSIDKSTSKALASVRDICNAVSLFGTQDGFRSLQNLADFIPRLESEIQQKEEAIQNLASRSAAEKQSSEHARRSQLSDFQQQYDQWKKDEISLRGLSQEWEATCQSQGAEMIVLHEKLKKYEAQIKDHEGEIAVQTTRSKGLENQLAVIEARLEEAMYKSDSLIQENKQIAADTRSLENALGQEREDHRVSKSELSQVKGKLKTYGQYSVKMDELFLPKMIPNLEGLWKSLIELVGRFIGRDLPPAVLEGDWTVLGETGIFKSPMALPKSNSIVAKRVRVALVVAALSMAIYKLILQPTYLLGNGGAEMRDVLYDQATVDEEKERHLRGILLSMFPDDQEKTISDLPSDIVKDVLLRKNFRILIERDDREEFTGQLQQLIVQFSKIWKVIQRARQKIEPDFSNPPSNGQTWYLLDENSTSPGKENRSVTTLDTGKMETKVVVIPPMYLVKQGKEQEPEPITHGYVFDKAHIDAAAEEIRRAAPSGPFPHASLTRHRSRAHRTAGNGASRRSQGEPFLP